MTNNASVSGIQRLSDDSVSNDRINVSQPTDMVRPASKVAFGAKERWASLVKDAFNEVDIGEFYTPDEIYVMLGNKFHSFTKLQGEINEFAANAANRRPLTKVEVGEFCLVLINGNYRRAQIFDVGTENVTVFIVDFGMEEYVQPDELLEIPSTIVERLPFQVKLIVCFTKTKCLTIALVHFPRLFVARCLEYVR